MIIDIVIPIYNNVTKLATIVKILNQQILPDGAYTNIILVNDGSDKDISEALVTMCKGSKVHLLHHDTNLGRSIARNSGCEHGLGEIIIMIDADCIPQGENFVLAHINSLQTASISCGKLISTSQNCTFWDKYQNEISSRRADYFHNKESTVPFTTANMAVRRSHYVNIGGFSILYKHYGFEDRDFLLRSQEKQAVVCYTPSAQIDHADILSLVDICQKMFDAGKYSSKIFRERHPVPYSNTPYSKVDVQVHGFLKVIAIILFPIFNNTNSIIDNLLRKNILPYFLKSILVKAYSAVHYMYGTSLQKW